MDGGIAEAKRRGREFIAAANKDQGAFFAPEHHLEEPLLLHELGGVRGKHAKEAADAYKARGGKIAYRAGDAASFDDAPSGDNVVAVCDPPYYLTADYVDGSLLPLDLTPNNWSYKATDLFLNNLVDKGDAIVYTDEAWWHKKHYSPDTRELNGTSTFSREQEILLDIINTFDHFDVAGRVAERQETLGIHHGHKSDDTAAASRPDNGDALAQNPADTGRKDGDRQSVRRVARLAEDESRLIRGAGTRRGREGRAALAREVIVSDIAASLDAASSEPSASADTLARHSVRLVREERMADYARTASKNAKRWLAKAQKDLDAHMAAHGYTEKVWHGTNGDDFNVFKFSANSHDVPAAYFTYSQGTAQNYAAIRAMDYDEDGQPNTRQFYVNPGKVLDLDETLNPTDLKGFIAKLKEAYEQGYNAVRVKGAFDDQGMRLDENDEGEPQFIATEEEPDLRTDILIVMQQPGDNAPARIKAADPVTFMDDTDGALPVPYEMRADQSLADVRFSVRTAWRPDFPKAMAQTTRANIMAKCADLFNRAKAGDEEAAADLIEKIVKPEKIRALVADHPNASIVAPVYAEEATGRNQLARKYADYISTITGIDADTDIVQTVRANHTGASADHRLFSQPEFDGTVKRGAEYIFVDDHITQGGTVNAMRDYIESNGGKVVAVSALTLSQGSSILSPHKDTIDEIKHKWPDINRLLRAAGIADSAEALTESQLRYILKFSPDTFRDRIAQAVEQGVARTQYETLGTPSEGVAREETEAERAAMRHSVFVGPKAAVKGAADFDELAAAEITLHKKFHDNYTPEARDEIYCKTGWWKGTDDKWRFEIRDVKPKKRGKTLGDVCVNGLYHYADSSTQWCPLTDMVSHVKLFKAYPKLKEIIVDIVDPDSVDFNAQYDPNRNRITLESRMEKDGDTLDGAIDIAIKVAEAAESGTMTQERYNTKHFDLDGVRAIVAFNNDGNKVITGYEISADVADGANRRSPATKSQPHVSLDEIVAALKSKLASLPTFDTIPYSASASQEHTSRATASHSVRRGTPLHREDIAVAMLAARRLAGKDVPTEDADKMLKNMGVIAKAADVLAQANALADKNRERLKGSVERSEPALFAALAREGMADRYRNALSSAITGGAALADPALGEKVQKAIQSKQVRDLMNAHGFEAAQMMLPLKKIAISLPSFPYYNSNTIPTVKMHFTPYLSAF